MAYSRLAYVYDLLMEDAPYDQWQAFIHHFVEKYQPNGQKLLDLGCGTGIMSNRFAASGYKVTAVDFSEDMLAYASEKGIESGHHIHYLQQDIRELNGLSGYHVVVSICDVVNYLTQEEDILKAFKKVADAMVKDGLFIFDIHSLKHFEKNMADQTFAEIYDDITYVWLCKKGRLDGEVLHDLTFFVEKDESGLFERFDETHYQRTFSVENYKRMIESAGLQVVGIHTDFSIEQCDDPENGDRIFFVCRK